MKKMILPVFLVCAGTISWASQSSKEVVMVVAGEEVPTDEFEYFYTKNNQQQLTPQSIEEYAEMFKLYKQKVADAKAEGLDTLPAFKKEMAQYRAELAAPYIADSTFIYSFVDIACKRDKEEVEANHIMIRKSKNPYQSYLGKLRLDSIRNEILVNGKDFNEMAFEFSDDNTAKSNRGYMGYIGSGKFPYDFETAVFETPEGEVSEIIESPAGYHLIKSGKRRPSRGKVEAAHIMKSVPQTAGEEMNLKAKAEIDSIYKLLMADPSRFGELAKANSDDKMSARNNGLVGWFGSGEMVPEFEQMAFSLNIDSISEPVRSMYGWHIIKKTGAKQNSPEEVKADVLHKVAMSSDSRFAKIRQHEVDKLAAKHNASINSATMSQMQKDASETGINEEFINLYLTGDNKDMEFASIDGNSVPVKEFVTIMTGLNMPYKDFGPELLKDFSNRFFASKVREAEESWLYDNEEDYRNLMNEYYDGSLLYEVSLKKVWNKASQDTEGLKNYFNAHKSKYTLPEPMVKGYLIQVPNEEIAERVKQRLTEIPQDSILPIIKQDFFGKVQIDRILLPKGSNEMVDELMFDSPKASVKNPAYGVYFLHDARIINKPEDMIDAKNQVIPDYQQELEANWTTMLNKNYPAKINKQVLKSLKQRNTAKPKN